MPRYLDHHQTIPDMPPEIDLDPGDVAEVQVLP